ncbi:hypothetical protein WMY93_012849 [Mugilogobius chulae]|uniref:EF-hand domain-containing protein n=1 Tax=Mugilogobius chulae TaxID=88201 RepID=A0AAW0NZX4_9GOBI
MGQTQSQTQDQDLELVSIQDLYKSFIQECPSGTLHLHEFKRMFGVRQGLRRRSIRRASSGLRYESCEYESINTNTSNSISTNTSTQTPTCNKQSGGAVHGEHLQAFDMNHDNTMDFIEYVAALHLVLRGRLEDKLRWSFKVFDSDSNGHLDKDEIRIIYKIKKGSVTQEKDLENMTPYQICERIFQEVDLNNDGEISLEEFLDGAQRSPWLQNFLHLDVNPSAWVQRHMVERKLSGSS